MTKRILVFICICALLFAVGCSSQAESSNSQEEQGKTIQLYLDSEIADKDDISLTFSTPTCRGSNGDYSFSISFSLRNKELKTNTYTISSATLIKEDTGIGYKVTCPKKIELQAEMSKSFKLSASIPSNYQKDAYRLYFELNAYKITLLLYNAPIVLGPDRTISYYIDGFLIHTDTVQDKSKLEHVFGYETADHLSHCGGWYLDPEFKTVLDTRYYVVSKDVSFYGKVVSNFKWFTTGSDSLTFLESVNHVPLDGILVLPREQLGKPIAISNFAIRNINCKSIYIPDSVHKIYGYNFTGIGTAKIYYEGSKEKWESLFYSRSDIIYSNVVFNATMPTFGEE